MDVNTMIKRLEGEWYVVYREGKPPEFFQSDTPPQVKRVKDTSCAVLLSAATLLSGIAAVLCLCGRGGVPVALACLCMTAAAAYAAVRFWKKAVRDRNGLVFEAPDGDLSKTEICCVCGNIYVTGIHSHCPYCRCPLGRLGHEL